MGGGGTCWIVEVRAAAGARADAGSGALGGQNMAANPGKFMLIEGAS